MSTELEKIATDRYRLRCRGQLSTLSAQDLLAIKEWVLQHTTTLELEAEAAQEYEDTHVYIGHYYAGGTDY